MSTLRVSNIQNASTSSGGIAIDTSGHVTVDGVAYPSAGSLSGRNRIINGDMRIDQRNAGAAVTVDALSVWSVDRWLGSRSGTINNFTLQRSTTAPAGFSNSLLITAGTGVTPATEDYGFISQPVEGFNFADLGWGSAGAQSVTISFWVRSSLTGSFGVGLRNGTANRSYIASYAINAANTWEYKTISIVGDTTGTWATDNTIAVGIFFDLGVGTLYSSTAGAWSSSNLLGGLNGGVKLAATTGATLHLTGVQLEVGSVATPFEHRSYGQELSLCQRYYETSYPPGTSPGSVYEPSPTAQSARTNEFRTWQTFSVHKRVAPTVKFYSPTTGTVDKFRNRQTGADINVTADSASTPGTRVSANAGSSGDLIAWNYTAEAEL